MPLGESKRGPAIMAVIGICDDGEVGLFDGIPVPVSGDTAPGVEVGSVGGYEAQAITSADWTLSGVEAIATIDFGPATDEWDKRPQWWLWRDPDGVPQLWGPLRRPAAVEEAISSVPVELVALFASVTQSTEE